MALGKPPAHSYNKRKALPRGALCPRQRALCFPLDQTRGMAFNFCRIAENCMETGSGLMESIKDLGESPVAVPDLLVELPHWSSVFRRNLLDLLRPKQQPPLRLSSKPAAFWPDVFVQLTCPGAVFWSLRSTMALCFLMLWASSIIWARRPQIALRTSFSHEDVIYYQPAELLPPLDTGGVHPKQSMRGDPVYAPQPIISVPREADNHQQTIVTPPNVKLDHDVPLPNVVSWPKTPLAMPIAATERNNLSKAPSLDTAVVEPPPDVKLASSRNAMRSLQPSVVQPCSPAGCLHAPLGRHEHCADPGDCPRTSVGGRGATSRGWAVRRTRPSLCSRAASAIGLGHRHGKFRRPSHCAWSCSRLWRVRR